MIAGSELQAWIGDRERQRSTTAAIEQFGRDWNDGPV